MDEANYEMLLELIKILQRNRSPETTQAVLDLVESYNEKLTTEQKAMMLSKVLSLKNVDHRDTTEQKFQEEWRKLQQREMYKDSYA